MKRIILSLIFPIILVALISANSNTSTKEISKLCIEKSFLENKKARPRLKLKVAKEIVIHGTGNFRTEADAYYNKKYFELGLRKASYHYLVDSENILQLIPLAEVSFNCGGVAYTEHGEVLHFEGLPPNYTTISIGMCLNKDPEKVLINTQKLISEIWIQYGYLPIVRHYDITGKPCPQKLVDNELVLIDGVEWESFKEGAREYHRTNFMNF